MNDATELNSKLFQLKDGSPCDACGRPTQAAEATPAAYAQQAESPAIDNIMKRDHVSISEQAKERLKVEPAFKLETPPHITTVMEHIQELAREALRPAYEEKIENPATQALDQEAKKEAIPLQKVLSGEETAQQAEPARNSPETQTAASGQQAQADSHDPGQPVHARNLIV